MALRAASAGFLAVAAGVARVRTARTGMSRAVWSPAATKGSPTARAGRQPAGAGRDRGCDHPSTTGSAPAPSAETRYSTSLSNVSPRRKTAGSVPGVRRSMVVLPMMTVADGVVLTSPNASPPRPSFNSPASPTLPPQSSGTACQHTNPHGCGPHHESGRPTGRRPRILILPVGELPVRHRTAATQNEHHEKHHQQATQVRRRGGRQSPERADRRQGRSVASRASRSPCRSITASSEFRPRDRKALVPLFKREILPSAWPPTAGWIRRGPPT